MMDLKDGTCICLVCNLVIKCMKEFNIQRHYERRHSSLIIVDRASEYLKLKSQHERMKSTMSLNLNETQIITYASFKITQMLIE